MRPTIIKIVQVAFHRNGVGGSGFHAVVFEFKWSACPTCGDSWTRPSPSRKSSFTCGEHHDGPPIRKTTRMLGVVFDAPSHVAVFDIDKLADPAVGVAFGSGDDGNSWCGDTFETELRAAICRTDSDGSVRLGPFAIRIARKTKKVDTRGVGRGTRGPRE